MCLDYIMYADMTSTDITVMTSMSPYTIDTSIFRIQSNLSKLLSFLILWQSEDSRKFNKEYTPPVDI